MTDNAKPDLPDLTVQRVRHPLRFRRLQVVRTRLVTPQLLRVTLGGADLEGFLSASFDDHMKLFFPVDGKLVIPQTGPDGPSWPDGPRPPSRDYTPRRYDAAAQELDIEFVLHGDGPASTWAAQAQPGQEIGVGGPRGSFVVPEGFDWHLLIGDDTALPAISRRLEELPAGKRVIAVIEVSDASAEVELTTAADARVHWLHRQGAPEGSLLEAAVRELALPEGNGFVWAAGEGNAMRAVRQCLVAERGVDKKRIRASAYWKRGATAVHEDIDD